MESQIAVVETFLSALFTSHILSAKPRCFRGNEEEKRDVIYCVLIKKILS